MIYVNVERTYDAAGNGVSTYTFDDGNWEEYTMNHYGDILSHKDSTGWHETYTYDANGSLIEKLTWQE